SERSQLREMLAELPGSAILVADAGFLGDAVACQMVREKRHFPLRVGGNVHLIEVLGYASEIQGRDVYPWPLERQHDKQPPLKLRLIVAQDEGKQPVYLATSVLDENALTDRD
ncbi:MAG: IS4 family transposase, partial [Pirellulales bacterium]|nr:IS4 family transposase [Pirellulales bacterium]